MRITISIPYYLHGPLDDLVRTRSSSRSAIYADALREYLARHDPEWITRTYNRLASELDETPEERAFLHAAASAVFKATEW
jgi:predicted transcriptional regulator